MTTAAAEDVATLNERLKGIQQELESLPKLIPSAQNQQRLGFHGLKADPAWVMIDFGRTVTPERIVIFPARLTVPAGVPSPGFPAAFQIEISDASDFATSIRIVGWQEPEPGAGSTCPS